MGRLAMGYLTRLTTLLVLHVAGAGLASPTILVSRNTPTLQAASEWLPKDNQTMYRLKDGEIRRLQLNSSSVAEVPVFITVSPCTRDLYWTVYSTNAVHGDGVFKLIKEYKGDETDTFMTYISKRDRFILQMSSPSGGAAAVSTAGESPKTVRLQLRGRSKRRLAANWEPSPIDPQSTTYCVVASHRRNYTSLCAAQYDLKLSKMDIKSNRLDTNMDTYLDKTNEKTQEDASHSNGITDIDNKIDKETIGENLSFNLYEENFRNYYRRKKFSRCTKVTDKDPMVACVGDRTHHLIENLDPAKSYYVSVFAIGRDRRAGSLLAAGSVRPRTATAKRLRENVPVKSDLKGGKLIFYYKATVSTGLWLSLSTCGGSLDLEVLVKGKRLHVMKNLDQYTKFYVPAPLIMSSNQDISDEGSIQFDSSSSEESKLRYVIKLTASQKENRENVIGVELTASTNRWGFNSPELAAQDGAVVRELRPRRSCHSLEIAFLPATHHKTDVIRYCITTRETLSYDTLSQSCATTKRNNVKTHCVSHVQRESTKVITQRINGLHGGRKYAIQVTAATKGNGIPYNILFADTNIICNRK